MSSENTRFSLTLQDIDPETTTAVVTQLRQSVPEACLALNDDGTHRADVEWPDFEEDMRRFSRRYPDYFFELQYQSVEPGEDQEPWLMVFQDGGVADHFCLDECEEDDD